LDLAESSLENKVLLERLILNCVSIPGTSNNLLKPVIVYDYDNSDIKLNEERLYIGVLYLEKERYELHSWFSIKDYTKFFCTKLSKDYEFNLYEYYKYSSGMRVDSEKLLKNLI